MKQRNDFVSNSSSSSFIIINSTNRYAPAVNKDDDPLLIPTYDGNCEFGWGFHKYNGFFDKLNFCALQLIEIRDMKDRIVELKSDPGKLDDWAKRRIKEMQEWVDKYDKYWEMLQKVVKDTCRIEIELRTDVGYGDGKMFAYIDHQSSVTEDRNMEMFEDETTLNYFLFSEDSYIKTGNDNEDAPEGWDWDR